ncbi:RND transporter [Flavobacterium akiainvivens]|uniref:RND transporter n=1 Tax=Flavobacterium akiainvivens TaxID=1202724 RepID=A0A0M8M7A3_9FLAO|nr:TolC family protein [Flavobacterium akiainvivens]KOS04853.1 RND transporter [Flavobacterium akiainvivens]SFQ43251.1 efflux transporter, outer membrane factor (OMF) lipoprotein, NodT family [Flavobacterium akiainvivens]
MLVKITFKNIHHILAAFTWIGCSVSKDMLLPDAAPETFRYASPKDSSSIGALPLRNFITDASLLSLIDTALVKNYSMQLALKNIEAAEVLFRQSKLGNLPEIRLQVTANTSRPSDNSLNGFTLNQFLGTTHIEDYNANLGMHWEADIWGKISNRKKGALAAYLQTQEASKAVQTRLIADVAQVYYNLLMLDEQLAIAKKNLELNSSTLDIINLQFSSGQVTSLAIQQAEAQKLYSEKLIPQLEKNIIIQENALSVLIGVEPTAIKRINGLDKIDVPNKLNAGFPSAMLSHRPDIKSAELELTIANAKVGVAKAALYPSLIITAGGGINSFKSSNWFNIPASLFGLVSGGITQPLFERGKLKSNVKLAEIDREKAVIRFRQSVLDAVGEVSDELVKIDRLAQEYAIAEKRLVTLQQASGNANQLFENGMATYLEVIIAQGNLLQAELELATVKQQQLHSGIALYRSLGGGSDL